MPFDGIVRLVARRHAEHLDVALIQGGLDLVVRLGRRVVPEIDGPAIVPASRDEQALVLREASLFGHVFEILRIRLEETVADQKHVGHRLDARRTE